jgi:beta-ribofuranosylaminobenzene 5'-phosphate synthase
MRVLIPSHFQASAAEFGRLVDDVPHSEQRFAADPTPLQRFLLATDGTVTPALAAYLDEPIGVRVLRQEAVRLDRTDQLLDARRGRRVLDRSVLLCGTDSGTVVLYADSRVALDRITAPVRADLLAGELPIGLVLRRHRVETFREWLGAGRRLATLEVAAHVGPSDVCWRTYAVISGGRRVMVVHEEFPLRPMTHVA